MFSFLQMEFQIMFFCDLLAFLNILFPRVIHIVGNMQLNDSFMLNAVENFLF